MATRARAKRIKVRFNVVGVDFRVIEVPLPFDAGKVVKLIWCAANDFTLAIPEDYAVIAELRKDPDFEVMG